MVDGCQNEDERFSFPSVTSAHFVHLSFGRRLHRSSSSANACERVSRNSCSRSRVFGKEQAFTACFYPCGSDTVLAREADLLALAGVQGASHLKLGTTDRFHNVVKIPARAPADPPLLHSAANVMMCDDGLLRFRNLHELRRVQRVIVPKLSTPASVSSAAAGG